MPPLAGGTTGSGGGLFWLQRLAAQFFADVERYTAAYERQCRGPVVQAQYQAGYDCGYSRDLRDFSDELHIRIDRQWIVLTLH
jgi:hypothetical protein